MEIKDVHYIQHGSIELRDDAHLIIRNAVFEHTNDYSFQFVLEASDRAKVTVENSTIKSSPWINWNFRKQSQLRLENIENKNSQIWHYFPDDSQVYVRKAKFWGTLDHRAQGNIEDSPELFIELVFAPGTTLDTELPQKIGVLDFKNTGEETKGIYLHVANSVAKNWGITVTPRSDVTIRNTDHLTVTFSIGYGVDNSTIELEGLRAKHYDDAKWQFAGSTFRLVNTTTNPWSPIIGGQGNTLILRDCELADNAFSGGDAKVIIEKSTAQFLRANDQMQMTVRDSRVLGDVLARHNSKITLINTRVGGKVIEEDEGKVIRQ